MSLQEKDEKTGATVHVEHAEDVDKEKVASIDADQPSVGEIDGGHTLNKKRTIRKLDRRIILILGALYAIALIDRTNLSSARVGGMNKELGLDEGERYSIATIIFFVPYIIFELPSNLVIKRIGARNLITTITVLWGVCILAMGFITHYTHLYALRVLLGLFEAGLFPAAVLLISSWYTRWETQTRLSAFYVMSMIAGGFANILNYGLINIPRAGMIHTWRWIFVILGVITILLGIMAFFLVVDFPYKNKFLTEEETQFVLDRVNAERGDAIPDEATVSKVLKHLLCWRTWVFGFLFLSSTLPGYAFAYFLPVILQGYGYSTAKSLCLAAPPFIVGAVYVLIVAWISDRWKARGLITCLNCTVAVIGCAIVGYHENKDVRYFGCFLGVAGASANTPGIAAFTSTNTVTHVKKAVASAVIIGMGGVGGILAGVAFRQADYPHYRLGFWITMGAQLIAIGLVGVMAIFNYRYNRKLDRGELPPIGGVASFRYAL